MDIRTLLKSCKGMLILSIFIFLPIAFRIIYFKIMKINDFEILTTPEIIAYSASLIAPSIVFIIKTHGKTYKLPWKDFVIISIIILYILVFIFHFIIIHEIDNNLNEEINKNDNLLIWAYILLVSIILIRIYSNYHDSKSSDFIKKKENDQDNFNNMFKEEINKRKIL